MFVDVVECGETLNGGFIVTSSYSAVEKQLLSSNFISSVNNTEYICEPATTR